MISKQSISPHIIEVWGDFALFSRPEMSVERYSYPCPTPSAARGIFDAIYFKPQFYWQVDKIELLSMPAYIALRRNEVGAVASASNIKSWMKGTKEIQPLFADDPSNRQQRQSMTLRGLGDVRQEGNAPDYVRYRLHAHIVARPGLEKEQNAYDAQFIRRASQGKCVTQPCFGCREFVAFFQLVDDMTDQPSPVGYSQDLGVMLYDVFDLSQVNDEHAKPFISVFHAKIDQGVLEVPPYESDRVRKPDGERRAG